MHKKITRKRFFFFLTDSSFNCWGFLGSASCRKSGHTFFLEFLCVRAFKICIIYIVDHSFVLGDIFCNIEEMHTSIKSSFCNSSYTVLPNISMGSKCKQYHTRELNIHYCKIKKVPKFFFERNIFREYMASNTNKKFPKLLVAYWVRTAYSMGIARIGPRELKKRNRFFLGC